MTSATTEAISINSTGDTPLRASAHVAMASAETMHNVAAGYLMPINVRPKRPIRWPNHR
jgi:hypothetical protein